VSFSVGWNKRSAVPALSVLLTVRIAGTALRLFLPTVLDSKNSQPPSVTRLGRVRADFDASDRAITGLPIHMVSPWTVSETNKDVRDNSLETKNLVDDPRSQEWLVSWIKS
jgi:hypothetical protein